MTLIEHSRRHRVRLLWTGTEFVLETKAGSRNLGAMTAAQAIEEFDKETRGDLPAWLLA